MKLSKLLNNMFAGERLFIKYENTYHPFYTGNVVYFRENPELMQKYKDETIYRITAVDGGIAIILQERRERT